MTGAYDPDGDYDDDSTPAGDTDHDYWSTDGRQMRPVEGSMLKGAPFAGYKDFADCVAKNGDKQDPSAYCGEIKHRTEDGSRTAASGLGQVQQVTDPDNVPVPQDDQLPEGVMFPIDPAFARQWVTGPQGAQPKAAEQQKEGARRPHPDAARLLGRLEATDRRQPQHQDDFNGSAIQHGRYLSGWNEVAGMVHALAGNPAMSRGEYEKLTGRPDLHSHYLAAYAEGRKMHTGTGQESLQATSSLRTQADTLSMPHQTTDDQAPPFNSAATTPPMTQGNGDYAAGQAAGKADRAAGQRPAFADNSSGVSPYVKGYAEGYGAPGGPQGAQDVPYSLGGDSGQGMNSQDAQRAFQVARASRTAPPRRVSAAFAPDSLLSDPEFSKGYLFASKWKPGQRLVAQGSAKFEAGLYTAITDRPEIQDAWLAAHTAQAGRHPELARRTERHASFTAKVARRKKMRVHALYLTAGTSTELITDGPGTSPDPMGATPINGPGTPPPMGGLGAPAVPGGAPPYQGAPPLPGGPVVPDDVMGTPQQQPQPSGPFTNTFSGNHPENATLAPVAPDKADEPGYSNKDAYAGDPHGGSRLAAFRSRVQASLAKMGELQ